MRSNKRRNQSTSMYLIALAYCNIGYLVLFLLVETLPVASEYIRDTYIFNAFFSWFGYPCISMFFIATVSLVLVLTLNRWLFLMYPVRSGRLYTDNTTIFTIAITVCFSFLFSLPQFLTYHPYPREVKNVAAYESQLTKYGKSQAAVEFRMWCHFIFLTILPWILIALLDFLIIKTYKDRNMNLQSLVGKQAIFPMMEFFFAPLNF